MNSPYIPHRILRHPALAFLIVLFNAWLWHHVEIAPVLTFVSDRLWLYAGALRYKMPALTLEQNRVKMDGPLPVHITAPDQVEFWFTHNADSTLLQNSKRFSILVSDTLIFFRGQQRIHPVHWREVKLDAPKTITGEWLHAKTRIIIWHWLVPIHLISIFLIWLVLLLATSMQAGAGLVIDAFNDGPLSFTILFQVATVLSLVMSAVMLVLVSLGVRFSSLFLPFFISGLAIMMAGAYCYIKFIRPEERA